MAQPATLDLAVEQETVRLALEIEVPAIDEHPFRMLGDMITLGTHDDCG